MRHHGALLALFGVTILAAIDCGTSSTSPSPDAAPDAGVESSASTSGGSGGDAGAGGASNAGDADTADSSDADTNDASDANDDGPVPPQDSGLPTDKVIIGTNDGSGWGPASAATIVGGGIQWERVELGSTGPTVAQSKANGFTVLAIANNTDDSMPLASIDPVAWGKGVVTQIQSNPGITLAEAGNEMYLKGTPGAGGTGNADPQHYGAMYLAAVKAMMAAGIHIPLLFNMFGDYYTGTKWSQDANAGGWLRDAVNANPGLGAAILANGVSTHPYGALGMNEADEGGTASVVAQETVAKAVLGAIPKFYLTEFGYDMAQCNMGSDGACGQQDQATKMKAAYNVFLADSNIKGIWWYQSHDDGTGQFGFMNNDNTTRPSFGVLAAFAAAQ